MKLQQVIDKQLSLIEPIVSITAENVTGDGFLPEGKHLHVSNSKLNKLTIEGDNSVVVLEETDVKDLVVGKNTILQIRKGKLSQVSIDTSKINIEVADISSLSIIGSEGYLYDGKIKTVSINDSVIDMGDVEVENLKCRESTLRICGDNKSLDSIIIIRSEVYLSKVNLGNIITVSLSRLKIYDSEIKMITSMANSEILIERTTVKTFHGGVISCEFIAKGSTFENAAVKFGNSKVFMSDCDLTVNKVCFVLGESFLKVDKGSIKAEDVFILQAANSSIFLDGVSLNVPKGLMGGVSNSLISLNNMEFQAKGIAGLLDDTRVILNEIKGTINIGAMNGGSLSLNNTELTIEEAFGLAKTAFKMVDSSIDATKLSIIGCKVDLISSTIGSAGCSIAGSSVRQDGGSISGDITISNSHIICSSLSGSDCAVSNSFIYAGTLGFENADLMKSVLFGSISVGEGNILSCFISEFTGETEAKFKGCLVVSGSDIDEELLSSTTILSSSGSGSTTVSNKTTTVAAESVEKVGTKICDYNGVIEDITGGVSKNIGGSKSLTVLGPSAEIYSDDSEVMVAGKKEGTYGAHVTKIAPNPMAGANFLIEALFGLTTFEIDGMTGSLSFDTLSGDIDFKTLLNVTIQGLAGVKIKGATVKLGLVPTGNVLTNITSPVVDLITGVPSIGVPTVMA